MNRKEVWMFFVKVVLVFLAISICSSPIMAADRAFPKTVIKLAHVLATETSTHAGSVKFSELMKERTGGAVTVQIFPNSQLGNEKDEMEQIRNGMIQMSVVGGMSLSNVKGWEPLNVVFMPFVMKQDTEEKQNEMLNKIYQMPFMRNAIAKAHEISGIRSLDSNWFYGMRHVTTRNKPIKNVADLKGVKIRTMDTPIARLAMDALGASVAPMAFSELYSALQMGVIDGQENPPNTIYTSKFYEVQKYMALTGHQTQSMCCVIGEKFYQNLAPELRSIIAQAALDAGIYQSMLQIKANAQNIGDMKAKGMIVNTVNRVEFAEKSKDAWKKFEANMGKGLYEQFLSAQK